MSRPQRRLVRAREPLAARIEREEPLGLLAHAWGEPLEADREPEATLLVERGDGRRARAAPRGRRG